MGAGEAERPEARTRFSVVSRVDAPAARGDPCVVVIYGPGLGRSHRIDAQGLVIGRAADADLVLDLDNVSRRHARVIDEPGGAWIEDLDSTNGTYVNDLEIERARLSSGDFIKVGGAILKFLEGHDVESKFHEEIYRLTIIDGLTGAYNKRYLLEFLDRELARHQRYQRPVSLILFDLDHFKGVNDAHGHLAGDQVLRRVAELVRPTVRKEQCFARYGGEEFAIVLPETPADKARQFAEKIRALVAADTIRYEDREIRVTISAGVAGAGADGAPSTFLAAADAALYRAKAQGRNRVEAA